MWSIIIVAKLLSNNIRNLEYKYFGSGELPGLMLDLGLLKII